MPLPGVTVVTGIQNKKVGHYLGSNDIVQMKVGLGSVLASESQYHRFSFHTKQREGHPRRKAIYWNAIQKRHKN